MMGDKIPKFGFKFKKRNKVVEFFGRKLSIISGKLSIINNKNNKLIINYKLLIVVGILALIGTGGTLALNGFFGGGAAIPEDTMTRGLAGYWSFDEGSGSIARDASGNNNHGTLANGPKWTQGKNGGALQFDGKDDYVNCGNSSSLDITDEITVEAWVKPDMAKNADIVSRYSYSGPTNNGGYILRLWNDGKFYFVTLNDSQGGISANANIEKWNHVVATYDADGGTNNMKLYVNGLLANQTTRANAIKSITQNLKIGASSYYYDGMVDSVKIYNRALSEAEVRYHYNHGGPVAHWDMDEGSGSKINDKSGNGNDGTISGATWTQGKYGSALSFDGVNDVVNAGNGASLNITKEITVGLWIKRNNLDTVANRGIIAKDGVGGYVLSLNYITADHKITYVSPNVGTAKTVSTIDDTEWHYVACTVNESENALKLYIDGKLDASYAKIGTLAANATSLLIGRRSDYFNGLIDDVRIYNYARTAEEIRLDYNAGMAAHLGPSGKTCSEDPASCMDYGLVGNWDMDEGTGSVLNDNSGNNNHGTLTNGPKWTQGKSGGALQFDGKDDYVSVASNTNLNMGANQDFTIETWIKYSNNPSYHIVAGKYCDIITAGYWLDVQGNNIRLRVSDAGGNYVDTITTAQYNDNKWHHVMAIADRDGLAYIYIDGNQVKSNDISSENGDTGTGAFSIGRPYDRNYAYFNGQIDELRIYNRALTEAEVKYHYNHGGAVAHWDMDEGSGLKINDKSGNGNDGTISGATWTQGKYGSALSFDGADDYASVANSASLNPTSKITVGLWAKRNGAGTGVTPGLLSKRANGFGLIWQVGTDTDRLSTRLYQSDGTEINSNVIEGVLSVGVWRYITLVADGTNVITYVDGVPKKSVPYNGTILTGTTSLTIGQQSSAYFNGLIDDVRIYNYARTEEEIRLDYNAGMATHLGPSGKTCSEDPASCMDYGLVGNWDMDEGSGSLINDNSGNNNHGTLTNGPKWTQGKNGGALQFDGKNDYVNCGNDSSLNITDEITISAWIRPWVDLIEGSYNYRGIVRKGGNQAGYHLMRGTTSSLIGNFYLKLSVSGWSVASGTTELTKDKWWYLVGTYDGARIKFYVNGILEGTSDARSGTINTVADNLLIGNGAYSKFYSDGLIDEVRIYNRALSAEEVRYHYNHGGPVAHWDMDEGEGTRAFDSSGNKNHGAISGATWVEGKYGSALSFDGADDYVDAGNDESLNVTGNMTIEGWVKPNAITSPAGMWMGVAGKKDGHNLSGYGLVMASYSPCRRWCFVADGLSICPEACEQIGRWDHLAGVYDGSKIILYQNGVLMGTRPKTGVLEISSDVFKIGYLDNNYDKFNGLIDDVRVYNYARTAEQIQMDYQQGVATHLK